MSSHQFGPWGAPRDAGRLEALGYMQVPRDQVHLVKRWLTRLGVRHLGRRSRLDDLWVQPWLHQIWLADLMEPGCLDVPALIEWYPRRQYRQIAEHHVVPSDDRHDCAELSLYAAGLEGLISVVAHWEHEARELGHKVSLWKKQRSVPPRRQGVPVAELREAPLADRAPASFHLDTKVVRKDPCQSQ
jgi:hypothetical protein